jgi:hypothetical protein
LPKSVFESAGGNGHSRSNTLWYLATRPQIDDPLPLVEGQSAPDTENVTLPVEYDLVDCYQPKTCTEYILDRIVDRYTCRQRMEWLMNAFGKPQKDACVQVASLEYPDVCGACNPYAEHVSAGNETEKMSCHPCSDTQCSSDLNRCPMYKTTFVCAAGKNRGGCSSSPWNLHGSECDECCELTDCPAPDAVKTQNETVDVKMKGDCLPCAREVCHSKMNQCPAQFAAPYYCYKGASAGGCSPRPWALDAGQCEQCCKMFDGCAE